MAKRFALKLTGRDDEILEALDRFPLTPDQLCKLSQTFAMPFSDTHAVRRRLRKLAAADLVRANPYAVASFGSSPAYYKLSRTGYRLLHGPECELPKRRYFDPIGQARHPHTIALVDMLVHLFVSVHQSGYEIRHYARENSVVFETTSGNLRPDAAFQIVAGDRAYNFVVELDNGSERVRSRIDTESIERKIRGYDAHSIAKKTFDRDRYVVLFVTTRSSERLKHMLAAASSLMTNPQRRLFIGTSLQDLLDRENVVHDKCFLTPAFTNVALIPSKEKRHPNSENVKAKLLPPLPAFC